jgi:hypothetical protein
MSSGRIMDILLSLTLIMENIMFKLFITCVLLAVAFIAFNLGMDSINFSHPGHAHGLDPFIAFPLMGFCLIIALAVYTSWDILMDQIVQKDPYDHEQM